jgi:hypothetical protein
MQKRDINGDKLSTILQKRIFRVNDFAAYAGVQEKQVRIWMKERVLPYFKPSGKIAYFKREDVDTFLLSNKVMSESEIETAAANYMVTSKNK